jgi:hypothetical protein
MGEGGYGFTDIRDFDITAQGCGGYGRLWMVGFYTSYAALVLILLNGEVAHMVITNLLIDKLSALHWPIFGERGHIVKTWGVSILREEGCSRWTDEM